jgi:hypothetical protein
MVASLPMGFMTVALQFTPVLGHLTTLSAALLVLETTMALVFIDISQLW